MKELAQYLGKYATEVTSAVRQEKYQDIALASLLRQRYFAESTDVKLTVDSGLEGLQVVITGNTIRISQAVYDHPLINIDNILVSDTLHNPRAEFTSTVFPSVAYLMCQNFIRIHFRGYIGAVVYVHYHTECETMHNAVVDFVIDSTAQVDIVETVASVSLFNLVTNYHIGDTAKVGLYTFYSNSAGGNTTVSRNVYASERAGYTHTVLAHGASLALDETRLHPSFRSNSRLLGIVNSDNQKFHSVLTVHPDSDEYKIAVDYRNLVSSSGKVSFYAGVAGQQVSPRSYINVVDFDKNSVPAHTRSQDIANFVDDVLSLICIAGKQDAEEFQRKLTNFKLE